MNCSPWINHGGPVGDSTTARSGVNACRPCANPGGAVNLVTDLAGHDVMPGERVHVEVWVRASDGGLLAQDARLYSGDGANAGDPARVALSNDDQRIAADYTIPLEAGAPATPVLNVVVSDLPDGGGGCALVDDVVACPGENPVSTSVIDCDDPGDCAADETCCAIVVRDLRECSSRRERRDDRWPPTTRLLVDIIPTRRCATPLRVVRHVQRRSHEHSPSSWRQRFRLASRCPVTRAEIMSSATLG